MKFKAALQYFPNWLLETLTWYSLANLLYLIYKNVRRIKKTLTAIAILLPLSIPFFVVFLAISYVGLASEGGLVLLKYRDRFLLQIADTILFGFLLILPIGIGLHMMLMKIKSRRQSFTS